MKGIKTYQLRLPKKEVRESFQKNIGVDPMFAPIGKTVLGEMLDIVNQNEEIEFVGDCSEDYFKISCYYDRKRGKPGPLKLVFYGIFSESSSNNTILKSIFFLHPALHRFTQILTLTLLTLSGGCIYQGISTGEVVFFLPGILFLVITLVNLYFFKQQPKKEMKRWDDFIEKSFSGKIEKQEFEEFSLETQDEIVKIDQDIAEKHPEQSFSIFRTFKLLFWLLFITIGVSVTLILFAGVLEQWGGTAGAVWFVFGIMTLVYLRIALKKP